MSKVQDTVNEFYSLAPKYRTKDSLKDLIETLINEEKKEAYNEGLQANQMRDFLPKDMTMTEAAMLSKDKDKETERLIKEIKKEAIEGFAKWFIKDGGEHYEQVYFNEAYALEMVMNEVKEYISQLTEKGQE